MKILEILPNPHGWREPGLIGGGFVRMIEVNKRWSRMGVHVETVENAPSQSLRHKVSYIVHEVALPFSKGSTATDVINLLMWTFKTLYMILRWRVRKQHFDAVISGAAISNAFHGWIASKLLQTPLIMYMQTIADYTSSPLAGYEKFRGYGWSVISAFLKSLGDWLSSRFVKAASAFICVSIPIADVLENSAFPKNKIYVTENGIDLRRINAVKCKSKEYDGVFLGRIEKEKGVPDVLRAWRKLLNQRHNSKLLIVGCGSFLEEAKKIVENHDMHKNVKVTGFVSEDLKYVYLKASRIFLFPTRSIEGWPLVMAEAMACGLPAICYDTPVMVSIFSDYKSTIFTPTGDVEKLADTILNLLENDKVLAEYSLLSRKYADHHDWDIVAKRELEILRRIAKTNGNCTNNLRDYGRNYSLCR